MQQTMTATGTMTGVLNRQVANFSILYVKLHQYHWLVKGEHFFGLHAKFEQLYDEAAGYLDELAERLLALQGKPISTMKEFLQHASVKEGAGTESPLDMVRDIERDFLTISSELKQAITDAAKAQDDPTADLLTGIRASLEKHAWMLRSFAQA